MITLNLSVQHSLLFLCSLDQNHYNKNTISHHKAKQLHWCFIQYNQTMHLMFCLDGIMPTSIACVVLY